MSWPIYMEDLLLTLKGKLKHFNLSGSHNIKSIAMVSLLKNQFALAKFDPFANGRNFFQLGLGEL